MMKVDLLWLMTVLFTVLLGAQPAKADAGAFSSATRHPCRLLASRAPDHVASRLASIEMDIDIVCLSRHHPNVTTPGKAIAGILGFIISFTFVCALLGWWSRRQSGSA
jgi:hypothetical protein